MQNRGVARREQLQIRPVPVAHIGKEWEPVRPFYTDTCHELYASFSAEAAIGSSAKIGLQWVAQQSCCGRPSATTFYLRQDPDPYLP